MKPAGRIVIADCGHQGEVVIGTFIRCLTKGCDGKAKPKSNAVPTPIDPEKTEPLCRKCGSTNLVFQGHNPMTGSPMYWCRGCKTYV